MNPSLLGLSVRAVIHVPGVARLSPCCSN